MGAGGGFGAKGRCTVRQAMSDRVSERVTELKIKRRVGESVRVGAATVEVASVDGQHVGLTLRAPISVPIVRGELEVDRVRQEQKREGRC